MPRKKAAAEDMPEPAIDENAEAPQEVVNEEAPNSAESFAEAEMPVEEHTSENAELRISDDMELMPTAESEISEELAALPPDIHEADAPAEIQHTHEEKNTEAHSFYDLNLNALDRDLSPEERREWNSIYASYRGRSALTGTIIGVDRHTVSARDRETGEAVRQDMYCAVVIPFRVRILIPASEMWFVGEERPAFVLRNTVGASIDFIITHIDREGSFAIGSRRLAMRTRRYYFSTQPSMHRQGARVKCRTLSVGPRRCLVECYGHDIDLTQREMRYTAIPDMRSEYRPGQELDCIVKEYDSEKGTLRISVKESGPNPFDGAELRHPEGTRRQAVIAGKYAGGVFCNLPDGAVVMCSYSFHYDDAAFSVGDRVIVAIQRYDFSKKQIYGKIVARW